MISRGATAQCAVKPYRPHRYHLGCICLMSIESEEGEAGFSHVTESRKRRTLEEIFPELQKGGSKIGLHNLAERLSDKFGEGRELRLDGYFYGNIENDVSVIRHLGDLAGDASKDLPALLENLNGSRRMAVLNEMAKYPTLTEGDLRTKIASGEIPNPYDMKRIEQILTENVLTESVTLHPPVKIRRPTDWLSEFSTEFQQRVEQYIGTS